MNHDLQKLLEAARSVQMTGAEREAQRRSFVFGNTAIENTRITREMVDSIADALAQANGTEFIGNEPTASQPGRGGASRHG